MPKLYSYTYMSLDGVMSSPEIWFSPYFSDEMEADLTQRLQSCAAMVLGHNTYTEFSQFWPRQGSEVPFADLNNGVQKYVVSRSLKQADWRNSTVVSIDDLTHLKSGGNLHITGSGALVRSLLERQLLDELVVILCPLVLGQGRHLFDGVKTTGLSLVKATSFPRGVQCLTYRHAAQQGAAPDPHASASLRRGVG